MAPIPFVHHLRTTHALSQEAAQQQIHSLSASRQQCLTCLSVFTTRRGRLDFDGFRLEQEICEYGACALCRQQMEVHGASLRHSLQKDSQGRVRRVHDGSVSMVKLTFTDETDNRHKNVRLNGAMVQAYLRLTPGQYQDAYLASHAYVEFEAGRLDSHGALTEFQTSQFGRPLVELTLSVQLPHDFRYPFIDVVALTHIPDATHVDDEKKQTE